MNDKTATNASAVPNADSMSSRLLGAAGRTVLTATAHFFVFSAVLFVMCGPVHALDDMFIERGGKYPVITVLIVNQGRWLKYYGWLLLYFPAVVLNAAFLFILNMLPEKWRWIPRCYSSLVFLAALFYVCLAFSAMTFPLQSEEGGQNQNPETKILTPSDIERQPDEAEGRGN